MYMESFFTRRSTLTLLFIGFLAVALMAGLTVIQMPQEIREKAAPETTLELLPSTQSVNQGATFTVDVMLRPAANQVTRADLTIDYDGSVIEGVSIAQQGSLLPTTVLSGIIGNGTANIVVGTSDMSPAQTDGVIARLTFRARNPATASQIRFNQSTSVTALGESGNAVASLNTATVTVTQTVFADTDLYFVPNQPTVAPGSEFVLDIVINTGNNHVSVVDLGLTYDPQVLEGVSLEKGEFLATVLSGGQLANGSGRIEIGAQAAGVPPQGTGVLARARFRALQGTSTVAIAADSSVRDPSSDQNMLQNRSAATITVQNSGNPTPTPVATPSPGSSPNPSPSTSPSPSATPGTGGANPSVAACTNAPGTPGGLTARAGNAGQVVLTWSPVSNVTHYGIVYGTSAGQYRYGAANVGNVTTYTVNGLTSGSTYYFAIFAGNGCGSSGYSNQVSVRAGGNSAVVASTSPTTPAVSPNPSPAAGFVPIGEGKDPISYLTGTTVKPSPSAIPDVSIPPGYLSGEKAGNFLTSPLGGILMIVVAVFLAIFFFRMRG